MRKIGLKNKTQKFLFINITSFVSIITVLTLLYYPLSYISSRLYKFDPNIIEQIDTYKGIPIYKTKDLKISDEVITSLHNIIDRAPNEFLKYKPQGFYLVSDKLVTNNVLREYIQNVGGWGGEDITITKQVIDFVDTYSWGKDMFRHVIYHEWMHIVDNKSSQPTFGEDLLTSFTLISKKSSQNYPYALDIGYTTRPIFNIQMPIKPTDLGQSDYGLTSPVEDIAETSGSILSGQYQEVSPARVHWFEDRFNINALDYAYGVVPTIKTSDTIQSVWSERQGVQDFLQKISPYCGNYIKNYKYVYGFNYTFSKKEEYREEKEYLEKELAKRFPFQYTQGPCHIYETYDTAGIAIFNSIGNNDQIVLIRLFNQP